MQNAVKKPEERMNHSAEIILHLQCAEEMFAASGASFYRKRMLNEDAEDYLVEEARRIPRSALITIKVFLPAGEAGQAEEIQTAIQKHFAYRKEKSEKQLKHTLQFGWRSLLIGFVFLGLLVILSEVLNRLSATGGLVKTVRESLVILGWVALWRPAELLLYEWYPYKRDALLFSRLENSKVQITASD
ncbi:MAG: hypothetical protein M3342_12895 [Bacteroidota bacterium]|nr:hypothetical protein [Flavisolibacter sp.]MBD0375480.1 hypothetical protein [Flavisolibacter sp.]MDQ3844895.1 hypothetical protein [Bacteroidota bacterium]